VRLDTALHLCQMSSSARYSYITSNYSRQITTLTNDWQSCGFTFHSTHNRSFRRRSPRQFLSFVWKTKPNTTKAHVQPMKRNVQQHTIHTKILKPGLVASCDMQVEKGEGLFWFWSFINLSLTYLDIYPLTYSPGTHTGPLTNALRN